MAEAETQATVGSVAHAQTGATESVAVVSLVDVSPESESSDLGAQAIFPPGTSKRGRVVRAPTRFEASFPEIGSTTKKKSVRFAAGIESGSEDSEEAPRKKHKRDGGVSKRPARKVKKPILLLDSSSSSSESSDDEDFDAQPDAPNSKGPPASVSGSLSPIAWTYRRRTLNGEPRQRHPLLVALLASREAEARSKRRPRGPKKRSAGSGSESDGDDDDDDDADAADDNSGSSSDSDPDVDTTHRKKGRAGGKRGPKKKKKPKTGNEDRRRWSARERKNVQLQENDNSDIDDEDVLEWKYFNEDDVVESLERVLRQRLRPLTSPSKAETPKGTSASSEADGPKPMEVVTDAAPAAEVKTVREFLVKLKDVSYLHLEWLTKEQVHKRFPTTYKTRLAKFFADGALEWDDDEDRDVLGRDAITIERIICYSEEDDEYMVKWKGQSYDACTWERTALLLEKCDGAADHIARYKNINSEKAFQKAKRKPPTIDASTFDAAALKLPTFPEDRALKNYQEEGFRWLVHNYVNNRNGILADEMGLGKTVQALALLQHLRMDRGIHGPFLVIAPLSCIEQWKREAELWTNLNAVIHHGSEESRDVIYEREWFFEEKEGFTCKFDLLVTTYEMIIADRHRLKQIDWHVIIVDEGHRLKNQQSKLLSNLAKIKSPHKILLTGTPLQNDIKELWTLMNYLEPERFNDCDGFLRDFGDLKEKAQVDRLQQTLGPFFLRRMKEDVDTTIPQKEETLIEIELTSTQKTYYRAILERNRDFLSRGTSKTSLMNIMVQLRKVCNHPYLLPGAEGQITKDLKRGQRSEEAVIERLILASSKFVFLDKLLLRLRESKKKVLIFSQMTKLLDIIGDYLTAKHYPHERLDGQTARTSRQASIDRFSDSRNDSFVFLLSTRAGGLGINLTIADTVVIFDSDWNPQNDLQAQARAHRIGQLNTVKIYRLITRNTYERRMFDVASKKLGLDKVVLESRRGFDDGQNLDKEEVERMLKEGAYNLFKATVEKEDFDFDKIMERASTVTYTGGAANAAQSSLSNFSKATFAASDTDKHVELDDVHFWDKVLPEFKSANKLLEQLKDPATLDDEDRRAKFLNDCAILVKSAQFKEQTMREALVFGVDSTPELLQVLRTAFFGGKFNAEHAATLETWIAALEQPRLRKRNTASKLSQLAFGQEELADSDYDEDDAVESEESVEQDDSDEDADENGRPVPKAKLAKEAKKDAKPAPATADAKPVPAAAPKAKRRRRDPKAWAASLPGAPADSASAAVGPPGPTTGTSLQTTMECTPPQLIWTPTPQDPRPVTHIILMHATPQPRVLGTLSDAVVRGLPRGFLIPCMATASDPATNPARFQYWFSTGTVVQDNGTTTLLLPPNVARPPAASKPTATAPAKPSLAAPSPPAASAAPKPASAAPKPASVSQPPPKPAPVSQPPPPRSTSEPVASASSALAPTRTPAAAKPALPPVATPAASAGVGSGKAPQPRKYALLTGRTVAW
eukprot:TRINITY_DN6585_c0_g1_i1.p1 TRINITY_DN6585_c0_g1~~TRINITY_DN6585_c0_g1_i1.p1  ORF type:complete len:1492 (-),score=458.16 TRINITY_DN6585_c0_g1_i1:1721-6196(-)